jgi:hypothetical protein
MTTKLTFILGLTIAILLIFGIWSYTGKARAEKSALTSDGKVSVLQGQLNNSLADLKTVVEAKDKIIARAKSDQKKAEDDAAQKDREKIATQAKYDIILGQIATKPPDEVVSGINEFIGPESHLLSAGTIEFSMVGGRSTLRIFTEGKKDHLLLTLELKKTEDLTKANVSLSSGNDALSGKVEPLTLSLKKCTDANSGLIEARDNWKKTAERSLRWEKIEIGATVIAVAVAVLKILKVF